MVALTEEEEEVGEKFLRLINAAILCQLPLQILKVGKEPCRPEAALHVRVEKLAAPSFGCNGRK